MFINVSVLSVVAISGVSIMACVVIVVGVGEGDLELEDCEPFDEYELLDEPVMVKKKTLDHFLHKWCLSFYPNKWLGFLISTSG